MEADLEAPALDGMSADVTVLTGLQIGCDATFLAAANCLMRFPARSEEVAFGTWLMDLHQLRA